MKWITLSFPGAISLAVFITALAHNFSLYFLDRLPAIADPAANAILIQQAKYFQLFHGNYSRVLFFHPGPAFLQVQAFGELLLHDLFQIVPTPVGSHRIAAIALNCLLLFALLKSVEARFGSFKVKIFAVIFTACLLLGQPRTFDTLWMPYLYIIPFACYVYTLGLLSTGKLKRTFDKALFYSSGGLLVHGHASFIGLTVIAFFIAVVVGVIGHSKKVKRLQSLLMDLLKPRKILLIPALFLLPIAIHTAVDFPGEIPKYFTYTQNHSANNLFDAIGFVVSCLPGQWLGLLVLALIYALVNQQRNALSKVTLLASQMSWQTLCITLFIAIFYAYQGIDDLSELNQYTILWVVGGFAVSIAFAFICLWALCWSQNPVAADMQEVFDARRWRRNLLSGLTIAVVCLLIGLVPPAPHPSGILGQSIVEVNQEIIAFAKSQNLEKVRINYLDHGTQWGLMTGVLSDLIRSEIDVCTTWALDYIYPEQLICADGTEWDVMVVPLEACQEYECAWVGSHDAIVYPEAMMDRS